jgi:large subunit ribosomal protein L37Ae
MTAKTKKIKSSGKFGAGFGTRVRKNYNKIEIIQRKRQNSPFYPKSQAKRIAAGIWKCLKTGRVFAGPAYFIKEQK